MKGWRDVMDGWMDRGRDRSGKWWMLGMERLMKTKEGISKNNRWNDEEKWWVIVWMNRGGNRREEGWMWRM